MAQTDKWPVQSRRYFVYTCFSCQKSTNQAIGYTEHQVGSLGTQRYVHFHYCVRCAVALRQAGKMPDISDADFNAAVLRAMTDGN